MKTIQKIFCISSLLLSFGILSVSAQETAKEITVEVNGSALTLEASPRILENSTMVPLRDICDVLGISVTWNDADKTVTLPTQQDTYVLTIDSKVVSTNGETTLTLPVAPTIVEGKTFVPLRFIAESTGAEVVWEDTSKTVSITQSIPQNLEKIEVTLGDKTVYTGESVAELKQDWGEPDRIEKSIYQLDWYIYNKDYTQFIMVAVADNAVVGYYTNTRGFFLNDDIRYGGTGSSTDTQITLYKDSNDENKIYGVLVVLSAYQNTEVDNSQAFLDTQSKENFDLLNAFRANYDSDPLEWNDLLESSIEKHCLDMAEQGYFAHESLDGTTVKERILATGIQDTTAWGENIVAGKELAIDTFDLWVNSEGHRKNMLRDVFTHVGISSVYQEGSPYEYYSGQNFVAIKDPNKEENTNGGFTIHF